ncbi:hypothetical protein FKF61_21570 [Salmonella enterica]|nr:hypothetical protein [Salmonella enterica]
MLKVSEINYPITFHFTDSKGSITYNSSDSKGIWRSGVESMFGVDTFVNQHNKLNKDNNPEFDYYYEMAEHVSLPLDSVELMINNASVNVETIYTASIGVTDYRICKIEEVPVGATLKGIQDESGEWDEITFKPVRVEIDGDTITLLSGIAGGYRKGGKKYGAEINIKLGTNVKFS